MRTTHRITTKRSSLVALVWLITWLEIEAILLETVILANFWMCFFRVMHYFCHVSGMVGSIDVKRKGSALVGYWVQYVTLNFDLTLTLTLDISRSNFEIALSPELLVWLMWNEKEVSWYDTGLIVWHCPVTTPMTLTLEFQGQSLKSLYLRNGVADGQWTKWMWIIHSWPWYWLVWPWWSGWMYRIVNGVTSDVGVPSIYLVCAYLSAC